MQLRVQELKSSDRRKKKEFETEKIGTNMYRSCQHSQTRVSINWVF